MPDKAASLQERFLNAVRREKVPVGLFLVKGVKLQGVITWFDAFSLLLRREGAGQLVYKHAIASIQPMRAIADFDAAEPPEKSKPELQDRFLDSAERAGEPMRLYLVSGIMLEGAVAAHDQFSILLKRGDDLQLIYKHAISTLQPQRDLDLGSGEAS